MFTRWFSQSSVCAEGLFTRLREGDPELHVEFRNTGRYVLGVAGSLLIFSAILFGIGFAENEPGFDQVRVLKAAALALGLAVVGGFATWLVLGSHNRRLTKRILAFDDAVAKYDFAFCGNLELEDAYKLPLVYNESLPGQKGKESRAWLCGQWNQDEFAWLQGAHLIDPVFRGKDTGLVSTILFALFGRKADKANRVQRMHFETIVFSEELQLPDVILGHSRIGVTSYLKRELKQMSQPLQGVPVTRLLVWGATSDSRGTVGLYDQLDDLFDSRSCLIQVVGGRVVVFLNYSLQEASKLVKSVRDVERELDFAHQIFQRIKSVAQEQSPVQEPTISYEEANNNKRVASFRERALRNKQRVGRRIGWRKVIAGVIMMGIAGVLCSGSLMVMREHQGNLEIQNAQHGVMMTGGVIGALGMLLTAWGSGFLGRRESTSMVTPSEAQATGLSSAQYFQSTSS